KSNDCRYLGYRAGTDDQATTGSPLFRGPEVPFADDFGELLPELLRIMMAGEFDDAHGCTCERREAMRRSLSLRVPTVARIRVSTHGPRHALTMIPSARRAEATATASFPVSMKTKFVWEGATRRFSAVSSPDTRSRSAQMSFTDARIQSSSARAASAASCA